MTQLSEWHNLQACFIQKHQRLWECGSNGDAPHSHTFLSALDLPLIQAARQEPPQLASKSGLSGMKWWRWQQRGPDLHPERGSAFCFTVQFVFTGDILFLSEMTPLSGYITEHKCYYRQNTWNLTQRSVLEPHLSRSNDLSSKTPEKVLICSAGWNQSACVKC